MNRPLTHQQRAVYEFIRDKIVERGYGPTVREIGEHMHIKSPNGVVCHLRALERKGMIARTAHKSRAIELLDASVQYRGTSLPVIADMTRGTLATNTLDAEHVVSLRRLTGPGSYALLVRDNSLLEFQIARGDYLVVEPCDQCEEGQLVLAASNGAITTLVKCRPEQSRFRLEPISSMLPTSHFYADEVSIIGVVVGVVRFFR